MSVKPIELFSTALIGACSLYLYYGRPTDDTLRANIVIATINADALHATDTDGISYGITNPLVTPCLEPNKEVTVTLEQNNIIDVDGCNTDKLSG